ncbi:MAG: saccharopine dehydrogenase NADP-binding domain-containing protein [Bacteroidales bacterium]|nr:saccharopine dehydrogenase NADP-binding domain-containing protein [Bacteroidales bacterium]
MKIIILGAGLIGRPIALDLLINNEFKVTVADYNPWVLEKIRAESNIKTILIDLTLPENVTKLVSDYDMVVNALPGFLGYQTLKAIIEAGKDAVDISFFPEDPQTLNELALQNNVTIIHDMGVAPGMSNVLVGYAHHELDKTTSVKIFAGGLPKERVWPFEYKAVFSPIDVIEEYTRPTRLIKNGKHITVPALSEREKIYIPGVGTLEAFNSDGLRSLLVNINADNMSEKTLRYPGHAEMMLVFRETGLFDKEEIEIEGIKISPLQMTSRVLFPKWRMEDGDEDITVMRLEISGIKNGENINYLFTLHDTFHKKTGFHSMARTTGYTATSTVRLLKKGLFKEKGVIAPEFLGKNDRCVEFLLQELREKGVIYKEKTSKNL